MRFGMRGPLRGTAPVPGDKSISHRALMLAAMAIGRSRIEGVCDGSDIISTAAALRAMGVKIEREGNDWTVTGLGSGGLLQPRNPLDMGNSGTSTRLLMGLAASHRIEVAFVGDSSLSRRPMDRVAQPLRRIGAEIAAAPGDRLPLSLRGASPAVPSTFRLEVPSAQVKSALLLAGLNTSGITRVIEPVSTRDHTERALRLFGADIELGEGDGERHIELRGEAELRPRQVRVPGDISAAAFLIVAALIVPGSAIRIENVGANPMRMGLVEALKRMGADISIEPRGEVSGEPVATIEARHSSLSGIELEPGEVPAMIDEFPIFFVAAAFAEGVTRARGLAELRIKESDRIASAAAALAAVGAKAEEQEDGLTITGSGGYPLPGGGIIATCLDHRIAMGFAVAGLHCREPITVCDMSPIATSFPGFTASLKSLLAS